MHNVEIYNCSQANTEKAAIRFEGAVGKSSHIANCSIHNGWGWAIHAIASSNIKVEGTIMFKFIAFGAVASSVSNFTMDSNIVAHITERDI